MIFQVLDYALSMGFFRWSGTDFGQQEKASASTGAGTQQFQPPPLGAAAPAARATSRGRQLRHADGRAEEDPAPEAHEAAQCEDAYVGGGLGRAEVGVAKLGRVEGQKDGVGEEVPATVRQKRREMTTVHVQKRREMTLRLRIYEASVQIVWNMYIVQMRSFLKTYLKSMVRLLQSRSRTYFAETKGR
eukprot:4092680-Pleurochrysis_carterae.AAC.2